MGAKITNARLTIETLVHAGYRSTASALAELVDNSIEAKAQNIRIIALNKQTFINKRTQNNIFELAVLDDGDGMSISSLTNCLSLGWGTRLDTREGLGRFGFGLKGASISQCRKITVYSWQGGIENCHSIEMDINRIIEEDLEELPEPKPSRLPSQYKNIFAKIIGESGTLVRWEELGHVDVKKTAALIRRLDRELCRIYRHFLDDDDSYGKRRDIRVASVDVDGDEVNEEFQLNANDPLYLLTPSNVPEFEDEAIFVEWEKMYNVPIETINGIGTVQIRSSVARPEIQKLGGGSPVGKHCAVNTGISFVRAGREIDFGDFGYIDSYDPRNRWWGVEIRFDPILDEIFGVTSNKQYVRNIKRHSENKREEHAETISFENLDLDFYKAKGLVEINHHIEKLVSEMMKVVKTRGGGTRTPTPNTPDTSEIVNEEIAPDTAPTQSEVEAANKSDALKIVELTSIFQKSDDTLTYEEALALANKTINYKVDLVFDSWPGKLFLDIRFPANGAIGAINREHNFYEIFWEHLEKAEDPRGLQAMKVMLMAYVRAEDEMLRRHGGSYYEDLRDSWGSWCHKLLEVVD